MEIILPKNHLLLSSINDVDNICSPLKELIGPTSFSYVRQYSDNTRLHLDNNPAWSVYFYKNYCRYLKNLALIEYENYSSGFYLMDYFPERMQIILKEGREYFDIANLLCITNKKSDFQEFYFIWTKAKNKNAVNLYLNRGDLVRNFTTYFKEKASHLIELSDKCRIALPSTTTTSLKHSDASLFLQNKKIENFQKTIQTHRSLSNRQNKITDKEIICLQQLVEGKTAKESAITLGISYKTVERHLANLKLKLGYNRKAGLVKFAIESGLI